MARALPPRSPAGPPTLRARRLCPQTARRVQILADAARLDAKAKKIAAKREQPSAAAKAAGKKFYQSMIVDSQYEGELFEGFSAWLTKTDAAE